MDYNYNTPLYYSFSEFLANYESDFNEWKTFYPDGTERYFLKTIYDKYNKIPYFNELESSTQIDSYGREYIIEEIVRKKTFSDYIMLPYFDGIGEYPRKEKVGFDDLAELITARIRFVLNPELKKGIEFNGMTYNLFPTNNISFDIQNIWDIQDIFDRQPTDGYVIDVFEFSSYTPFMEIKKTDDDLGYVYFNEYKYKNFEYTVNQILDWIDDKKNKLQNTGFIKSNIKWQGTQTELTELIKALIENGNIQGTQKDVFNSFTDFLNFDINNQSKLINDIKNRNNGSETIFLDKLKSSLLNFINRENKR